ncbi:hypothetical protein, partial [Lentimonas sp. CC6]
FTSFSRRLVLEARDVYKLQAFLPVTSDDLTDRNVCITASPIKKSPDSTVASAGITDQIARF